MDGWIRWRHVVAMAGLLLVLAGCGATSRPFITSQSFPTATLWVRRHVKCKQVKPTLRIGVSQGPRAQRLLLWTLPAGCTIVGGPHRSIAVPANSVLGLVVRFRQRSYLGPIYYSKPTHKRWILVTR